MAHPTSIGAAVSLYVSIVIRYEPSPAGFTIDTMPPVPNVALVPSRTCTLLPAAIPAEDESVIVMLPDVPVTTATPSSELLGLAARSLST